MALLTASLQFQFSGIWGPTLFRVPWQPGGANLKLRGNILYTTTGMSLATEIYLINNSRCRHNGDNVNEDELLMDAANAT